MISLWQTMPQNLKGCYEKIGYPRVLRFGQDDWIFKVSGATRMVYECAARPHVIAKVMPAEASPYWKPGWDQNFKEAEALANFEPEADVELRLVAGERVALLVGCTPPSGWSVALRRSSVSGGRPTKGLVPATYVQLLPFEASVVLSHAALDPNAAADPQRSLQRGQR